MNTTRMVDEANEPSYDPLYHSINTYLNVVSIFLRILKILAERSNQSKERNSNRI